VGPRCANHVTPLYSQKLALTSPTGGGRSVGMVRSRTKATEFSLVFSFRYKSRSEVFESVCVWFTDCGTCLQKHLFFVMEYVSGGNMAEELERVRVFSEERARFYAAEITLALEFLHRYGILHR